MQVRYPNLAVINGFIDQYLERRKNSEETTWGKATHFWEAVTDRPNKEARIEKIGKKIAHECSLAHRAETEEEKAKLWMQLLICIGNEAYQAQQATYKNGSNFCEMLHALRGYILRFKSLFPAFDLQIKNAIEQRLNDLATIKTTRETIQKPEVNKELKVDDDLKKNLAQVDEERDQKLRELAYLGNLDVILDLTVAERQALFPRVIYFEKQMNNPLHLYPDFPLILNNNFLQFYINIVFAEMLRTMSVEDVENFFTKKYCEQFGMKETDYLKNFIGEGKILENNITATAAAPTATPLAELNVHTSKRRGRHSSAAEAEVSKENNKVLSK